jgi:acyl-CoA synthetase (AMP-forming)/AMP-acid ligase II
VAAAVVMPKAGRTLTSEAIQQFCKALPRYNRPRRNLFGEVPRNPTGKIEKPKLRQRYGSN